MTYLGLPKYSNLCVCTLFACFSDLSDGVWSSTVLRDSYVDQIVDKVRQWSTDPISPILYVAYAPHHVGMKMVFEELKARYTGTVLSRDDNTFAVPGKVDKMLL